MKIHNPLFDKVEAKLQPAQGIVTFLLLMLIAISVFMLFAPATLRTAWVVWMVSP